MSTGIGLAEYANKCTGKNESTILCGFIKLNDRVAEKDTELSTPKKPMDNREPQEFIS